MSKELKTWENLLEGYDKNEDVIYFADKDKLDTIEVALKEHEQYKAFEEEAGISVFKLFSKQLKQLQLMTSRRHL